MQKRTVEEQVAALSLPRLQELVSRFRQIQGEGNDRGKYSGSFLKERHGDYAMNQLHVGSVKAVLALAGIALPEDAVRDDVNKNRSELYITADDHKKLGGWLVAEQEKRSQDVEKSGVGR